MAIEIERKFLVHEGAWRQAPGIRISQGYLNLDPVRTVRVRIAGERAFLAVKGVTRGATRAEFEYPIPVADARALLQLCDGAGIDKIRHLLAAGDVTWEVDEFLGDNAGLVVAEVELHSEAQAFERPEWLANEVTSDPRYYNASLAANPYCRWREGRVG